MRLGMPYTATASFDTAGRTMMGLAPSAYAELFEGFATAPLAFGANCGVGAADLLVSVLGMSATRPQAKIIAKANAGVPQWHGAHIHYSGTPELMADYARPGGRCRGAASSAAAAATSPTHVAAMRRALDAYRPGERPTVREHRRRARGAGLAAARRRAPRAPRPPPQPRGDVILRFRSAPEARRPARSLPQPRPPRAFSRTRLKALIEDGLRARRRRGRRRSRAQARPPARWSTLDAPPAQEPPIAGEDIPLDVVFEDEHLIVVNKPAGLVTHPAPGHSTGTLVNALIRHCGAMRSPASAA